ncbi:zinc-dependent peptidase [Candidatus Riflebacteria bacterium]
MRKKHRKQILAKPIPDSWNQIVRQNFPLYKKLPPDLQKELFEGIQILLAEKRFEGCGGLELTEEIRVTVAAQAAMLLLNKKTDYYPGLYSIVIYPTAFFDRQTRFEGGLAVEGDSVRLGESHTAGIIVLSWDDSMHGARDPKDGQNVVMHEFAHQLDTEDGIADGCPVHTIASRYLSWARVLGEEYEKLQEKAKKRKKSVMDKYGATHPAEFFAVATECFFEKPKQMKKKHPELYEELKTYFQMDPVDWK